MANLPARLSSIPTATYRLQFHAAFTFAHAANLAPYFQQIGVSHIYASPILRSRAGSMHGYDTIDYTQINPELGGEDAFRAMAATLRAHGIGIILDIVPNHMAVGGADNALWLDVLKHGRESRYAKWFDIDFDVADADLRGKVHAPFLGAPYGEERAAGRVTLQADGEGYAIAYGEHLFPIRPADEAEIRQRGLEHFGGEAFDALVGRQNFQLDWWRNAGDRINWRRFFDVTQLAAMRMEEPEAFEACHAIPFRLYRDGLIDGVRVDHVDGLTDPQTYCQTLRARLAALQPERPSDAANGAAWIVVEKILAPGEELPKGWGVDGTTGYDFMDQVSALQHAASGQAALESHWAAVSGRSPSFHPEEDAARRQILAHSFDSARARLIRCLVALASEHHKSFITPSAMDRAATHLLIHMRVYRLYGETLLTDGALDRALADARRDPMADGAALDFIADSLRNEGAQFDPQAHSELVRLFNQISAPLAAKAVEDTAFYRYGRLLSRNDVGFDAALLGSTPEQFHAAMETRARNWPRAMVTSATHDHKRGEDVRARLAVISEAPDRWIEAQREWSALNAAIRPDVINTGDEYHFYQMIAGSWPLDLHPDDAKGLQDFHERIAGWRQKSLREAKLISSWAAPDEAYEKDWEAFQARVFDPAHARAFLESMHAYVESIAGAGAANGLVQMALRCMAPGVPDQYQGTEFWDFSFVDPDNRRPVDYSARRRGLAKEATPDALAATWRGGDVKQHMLRSLLSLRRAHPELFAGAYEPLKIVGKRQDNVIGFLRREGNEAVLVVAALRIAEPCMAMRIAPPTDWWGDTRIEFALPVAAMIPIVGPAIDLRSGAAIAALLEHLPVNVCKLTLGGLLMQSD